MDQWSQRRVFVEIEKERHRQDQKWGRENVLWKSNPHVKMTVLTEEIGEAAMALNDGELEHLREELVQCAAVCVAWLEAIHEDRL